MTTDELIRACGHLHEAIKLRARALPEKTEAKKFT